MKFYIKKSYILLFSTAIFGTAALTAGAFPYHAGSWKNSAIEDLSSLWEAAKIYIPVHGGSYSGGPDGNSRIAVNGGDFAFIWRNAAMRALGTLPAVTFNRADGAGDSARIDTPLPSPGTGRIVASAPGNGAMRYLAGTTAYAYGTTNPPLMSNGTINDPTTSAYGTGAGKNNTTGDGGATQTPTPLPAALPLFCSGLACLMVWRRVLPRPL